MTENTTRRTIVKGAAWAAPVVAIAVAAPAYATSIQPPQIQSGTKGGKCPGQSTDYEFGFIIPLDLTGPVDSLVVSALTYNGEVITDFCTSMVSLSRFALTFDSTSSANGTGGGSFDYTVTYAGGTLTYTGTATFEYNGTHPVDKPTCNAVNCG